jgi:hypothetical protein
MKNILLSSLFALISTLGFSQQTYMLMMHLRIILRVAHLKESYYM